MRRLIVLMVLGLGLSLVVLPMVNGYAEAAPKVLKIGNTVPLKAKEGIQIKNWLELLAERLNNSGGLRVKGERYNVKIISYDDEYSADTGRAAAERLIYQDKVKHIICQWGSAPIVATLKVAEINKVLQIGNGMTEVTMEPQWHYYYRSPSLFWVAGQNYAYFDEFKRRGLPMTIVQINPDDITGRGATKKNLMTYKNIGIKALDNLFYKRGTTDYTPFATKIKSLNPGFVDTGATRGGAPSLLMAKALYDVGYKGGKIFNNMANTYEDIVNKVGPKAIEGAVGGFKDPRDYRTEKWVLDLCDAYEKKYGIWETDATNWIGGWFILMEAIKKADSLDVDDLAKALDGMEYSTLYSKGKFVARPDKKNSRTCDSVSEQYPGIIRNGKFEILKKVSTEENYSKTITAYGLSKIYGSP